VKRLKNGQFENALISRGAPTDLALEMAEELGVTVIGFARGKRLNIYTHAHGVKI
jgi:FdhD protein